LPEKWARLPVGEAQGMSIHESQSLLMEMQIGRSRAFLSHLVPIIKKIYGARSKAWSAENVYKVCTRVEPSLIRVDADEVTYPVHIMLRYHIEKYLLSGDMSVADLPEAWSQGMKKFLNIEVPNDKDGCMQDIHWMDGTFGYFPTYTIGAIYASQQAAALAEKYETLGADIEKGKLDDIKEWLKENIHGHGSGYTPDKLMKKAVGSELDADVYKQYLEARYLEE
jgi:carboxypeptidase Taq